MTEAYLRLRWELRFPGNKMNESQWRSYWQRLDHMDPLLAPEHPLAERVVPPPDGITAYAVRADLWHRVAAVVSIDPQESIGLARDPDGRYCPCRNDGLNKVNTPRQVPQSRRAAVGADGTLLNVDQIQFEHCEHFIWQQAMLVLRPAAEPQATSKKLWERVSTEALDPHDCLWRIFVEPKSVGNRPPAPGSILG